MFFYLQFYNANIVYLQTVTMEVSIIKITRANKSVV